MAKTYVTVKSVRDDARASFARYNKLLAEADAMPIRDPERHIKTARALEGQKALEDIIWQLNAIIRAEQDTP